MSRCTPEELQATIDRWLGGSEGRTRHPLNRKFVYTDGLKDVAEKAGAYWLLDIIATECVPRLLQMQETEQEHMLVLFVNVWQDQRALLCLARDREVPNVWFRAIDFTDLPVGEWTFYLCVDGVIDAPNEVVVGMVPTEY